MSEKNQYKIVFDQAHNNSVEIETNAYDNFIQWLFQQGFKIGKITQKITYQKLLELFSIQEGEKHHGNLLILGNPQQNSYEIDEIYAILEFVKNGGNILIFGDEGGDLSSNTNLNELTTHFGYKNLPNIIFDETSNTGKIVWPLIKDFENHPISNEIESIVYASGCSFVPLQRNEFAEFLDVKIKPIVFASEHARMKIFDPNLKQWKEEYANKSIVGIAGQFFEGRFFEFGTPSILSSLNSNYGWSSKHNMKFIQNTIIWLLGEREAALGAEFFGDKVQVQMRIEKDIFRWANSQKVLNYFGDFSVIVNHALKRLKKSFEDHEMDVEPEKPSYTK